MIIRDAISQDAAGIAAIYNDAVAHTTAIWNEHIVDAADRDAWRAGRQRADLPVLVAADHQGAVLGYASFGPWRAFDGYRNTVEHCVYVRADRRGQGIGTLLLHTLINRARALGKHVMVAGIDSGNTGSIRLHKALGFESTGTLHQVGTKFGAWRDLTFLQLTLDTQAAPSEAQQ